MLATSLVAVVVAPALDFALADLRCPVLLADLPAVPVWPGGACTGLALFAVADPVPATLVWPGAWLLFPCDSPLCPCGSPLFPCAEGAGDATDRGGAVASGAAEPDRAAAPPWAPCLADAGA